MTTSAIGRVVAGQSGRRLPIGLLLLAMPRILPRCAGPIRGTAARVRYILFCGGGAERSDYVVLTRRIGNVRQMLRGGHSGQCPCDNERKYFCQLIKIIDRYSFVKLVHGRIAQTKLHHWHDFRQKAGIGSPA